MATKKLINTFDLFVLLNKYTLLFTKNVEFEFNLES